MIDHQVFITYSPLVHQRRSHLEGSREQSRFIPRSPSLALSKHSRSTSQGVLGRRYAWPALLLGRYAYLCFWICADGATGNKAKIWVLAWVNHNPQPKIQRGSRKGSHQLQKEPKRELKRKLSKTLFYDVISGY